MAVSRIHQRDLTFILKPLIKCMTDEQVWKSSKKCEKGSYHQMVELTRISQRIVWRLCKPIRNFESLAEQKGLEGAMTKGFLKNWEA